ncbi:tetratricopeptide repeat protein [Marinifilum sp. D737]|uniref:tetratricopeptide repeat protein n=1 Tax=Marinifilum sp. D737 TaxID=2969628 RepID=UPI002274C799|nr:tetratricopeptide repeat protein [Marinifilum sp. D737]MCY1635478.1 tetratricopeptide repeat protein [Marinifilum sp. D737]
MKRFFLFTFVWIFFIANAFCNNRIDSLLNISQKQTGKEYLHTYLKITEDFSCGNNGDTIIYYAEICHSKALELHDDIAQLKALFYWSCGLYSNKKYDNSLEKVEQVIHISEKLNRPREVLQAYYLKARNYQGSKQYDLSILSFQEAYHYSTSLFESENKEFAIKYYHAILKQLSYTYWYAAKLHDGIEFFQNEININTSFSENLLRSYYTNISFLYNRGIDIKQAKHYLLKAAEISDKEGNTDHIYMDQAYLGALYANMGNYPTAIKHYERAFQIAKNEKSSNKISYIILNLGICYDANGNLKKGVDLIFDGIEYFIKNNNKAAEAKAYQHLGRLMIKWHNFKDADQYLHKAISMHKELNLPYISIADYSNLIISKYSQSEKDSIYYYLDIIKSKADKYNATSAKCIYYLSKSQLNLYFDKNPRAAYLNLKKADKFCSTLKSTALSTYINKAYGDYYLMKDSLFQAKRHFSNAWAKRNSLLMLVERSNIAQSLSKVYKSLNQADSAYIYLQKADSINKKIHHREDVLMLYQKDNDFKVLQAKKQQKALAKENKKLFDRILFIRAFYIILCISLIGLLVIYMKKRTRKLKTEIQIKESAQEKLKQQNQIDKTTIEKNNELLKIKEETIEQLKEKLANNPTAFTTEKEVNELEALLSAKLTTEEDWDNYLQLFTKKNPNFIPTLKIRYQNLSRNEIKIFTLIKLGLTTREMSGILMISPSSVNTARYRLRKKLKLEGDQKLEDIIAEMITQIQV